MRLGWRSGAALVIAGIVLGGTLSAVGQSGSEGEQRIERAHARGPGGPGGPGHRGGPAGPGHHLGKLVTSETLVEGPDEGTFKTIYADGGTVSGVDGNTISIDRADGETVRVTVDDDTEIRRDREEAEVGDLERGDRVMAHRVKEGDADVVTKHVFAISAERYAEMEEQRAACTDDDESTECEWRMHRGPRDGGDRPRDADSPPEPVSFGEAA